MSLSKPAAVALGVLSLLACGVVVAVIVLLRRENDAAPLPVKSAAAPTVTAPSLAYQPQPLGLPVSGQPIITHVAIADLDRDGLPDVVVCDARAHTVSWIRQAPRGVFIEHALGDPVMAPAHASVCDLNGDALPDLLVASMGAILPNNDRIGSVVVLENLGGGRFRNRVLADNIARVADVRGAELNGDGRLDLVVGQFGYLQGEVRWMENLGDWQFKSHVVLELPGTIHTPVADFTGDGRPDFAALVSQDIEEIHLFSRAGEANAPFKTSVVWKGPDPTWNSSGLDVFDLNGDGRPDLLYTNGDGFDAAFMAPHKSHGLQWLENRGGGAFAYRRIGDMPGCYSPIALDLNDDRHLDIVTVSAFHNANDSASVSLMAWINDGAQRFAPIPLASDPTHLITVAAGDLDGTGIPVLVTGGFHVFPPYIHMSRVTLWRRR